MNKTPTTLIIMDGFGLRRETAGNAIAAANTPRLDQKVKAEQLFWNSRTAASCQGRATVLPSFSQPSTVVSMI